MDGAFAGPGRRSPERPVSGCRHSSHARKLRASGERPLLRQPRQGRRLRQVVPPPDAGGDRQPDRHPPQPRYAYSSAVFDLDAGPVTITLPDAGKRFMSMHVIDEDEYTIEVDYGAGSQTLTKEEIGTSHAIVAVRT